MWSVTKYGVYSLSILLLDRALKWYVQSLPEGTVFSFFTGFKFGYFLNPALFFFPAWWWIRWFALGVLIVLAILMAKHCHNQFLSPSPYPLVPILLGGASNVFDRFVYGGVIDYVHILGIATINLADILIVGGLILILRHSYEQRV